MRNSTRSLGLFVATGMVVASGLGFGVWRLSMPSSTTTTDTAISSSLVSTEDPVSSQTTTSERFFEDESTARQLPVKTPTVAVSPRDPFLAPNSGPGIGGTRPGSERAQVPKSGTQSAPTTAHEGAEEGGVPQQEPNQPLEEKGDPVPQTKPSDSRHSESNSRPSRTEEMPDDTSTQTAPSTTPQVESTTPPTPAPATTTIEEPSLQPADPPLVDPSAEGKPVPTDGKESASPEPTPNTMATEKGPTDPAHRGSGNSPVTPLSPGVQEIARSHSPAEDSSGVLQDS